MNLKNRYTIELSGVKIPEFAESVEEALSILADLKRAYGGSLYIRDHMLIYKGTIGTVGYPIELFNEEEEEEA